MYVCMYVFFFNNSLPACSITLICNTTCLFHHLQFYCFGFFNTYIGTYILTYLLTPWSRVLLEKLTGSAASQEIPHIFGTRRFITVPTSSRHLSLYIHTLIKLMYVCMYVCTYVCMYVCMCVYVYVYMYVCLCMCVLCMYICMYVSPRCK